MAYEVRSTTSFMQRDVSAFVLAHKVPQAQPQMIVAQGGGGNRNAKNLPMGPEGREWSNGLCSCCDTPGTCEHDT